MPSQAKEVRYRLLTVRSYKNYYRRLIFYKGTKGLTVQWTTRNGIKAEIAQRMMLSMIAYLEKEEEWLKAKEAKEAKEADRET